MTKRTRSWESASSASRRQCRQGGVQALGARTSVVTTSESPNQKGVSRKWTFSAVDPKEDLGENWEMRWHFIASLSVRWMHRFWFDGECWN